ncbi:MULTISPECIES: indole-3-glycerol phosphate synthase TrpC [Prosthecochloris]|uniref:Indole-3-glycerol phosphate synthase n=1 Tax=Prosthecochloris vibrioformis TaxID=1098 RepID=A0A5C4S0K3_PROVB|nr:MULTISPECIES: indole-3-glycerol phosphate synthase TrpC [Prosthecochloris]ANT64310.1 Indole-3-glycerol phosphate synthase [Prosthecochloris sp. CIB 2401]TNJ36728.1 indole-3-glycerol phosphate synthase TrpC [Prosthecochloris vibrioformis]
MGVTYLTRILEHKAGEVADLQRLDPARLYQANYRDLSPTRGFASALRRASGTPVRLIAEVKKASPSRGVMVEDFQPLEIARNYSEHGASAFSVLTDRAFFQGSNEYLTAVSREFSLPVLRKDFIIDESQVYEARLIGADAILLIVAALGQGQLREYLQLAGELSLDVLVEVHDARELEVALAAGATIVGVNNRDLRDFSVSLDTALSLRPEIPDEVVTVSESGLKMPDDVRAMDEAAFDAVLIGEGLLGGGLQKLTWKPA